MRYPIEAQALQLVQILEKELSVLEHCSTLAQQALQEYRVFSPDDAVEDLAETYVRLLPVIKKGDLVCR